MNAATIYPIAETAPTPVTSAAESHPTPSRNHSMKATYFFSHDQNARHDAKISAMRSRYGAEGYGRYWIVIEMLAEEGGHKLLLDECTWDALAMQMQCTPEHAQQFVGDCISRYRLLDSDGESFWSESLLRRLTRRDEVIDKRRNAAKKRWSPIPDDAHAMQMHSTSNAFAMQNDANEIRVDEIRENTSRERETREAQAAEIDPNNPQHGAPDVEAIVAYGATIGKDRAACEAFHANYGSQGWHKANGRPVMHWPLLLRSWAVEDAAGQSPRRPRGPKPADSPPTPTIADAWWIWGYETAADRAAKEGVADHHHRWVKLRGTDGKLWFCKPENLSRGMPAGFAPWGDA